MKNKKWERINVDIEMTLKRYSDYFAMANNIMVSPKLFSQNKVSF